MKGYGKVDICHGEYFFDAFGKHVTPIAIDLVPGTDVPAQFSTDGAESQIAVLPVLDGRLDYLAPLVPRD